MFTIDGWGEATSSWRSFGDVTVGAAEILSKLINLRKKHSGSFQILLISQW